MRRFLAAFLAAALGVAGCGSAEDRVEAPGFLTDRNGGPTTARALRGRPYNQSARNLDNRGLARFAAGAEPFDRFFLEAEGVGPDHDGTGCLSCHLDGTEVSTSADRDRPPGLIVRISLPGTDTDGRSQRPVPVYGLQLTPESTHGDPEASIDLRWSAVGHRRADGSVVELRRPNLEMEPRRGELPDEMLVSPRVTPPMIGLGLLEAIPEGSLRAAVAAQSNAGEVSGRLNEVVDGDTGETVAGRFGWKAGQYSVESQTLAALHGDLGLSGPDDVAPGERSDLTREELDELVFYNRTIAVPISRGTERPMVRRGASLFESTGCSACHSPTQKSGPDEIGALSNVTFHPYTDLLLHDMGERLADGRPEFSASGNEWRTPPLWGLGRRVEVTGAEAFLHDGRARTPEEAIYWHDGEARAARHRFELLGDADAQALLAFLDSL
ncbi:MAG: c-type cytochrome [Microthrixaceae bacterium]|nr:c-type cytochrome [Microthrixaceae bacterium]